jgi:hypothetical protein
MFFTEQTHTQIKGDMVPMSGNHARIPERAGFPELFPRFAA